MVLAKIRTPRELILQQAVCLRGVEQTGAGITGGSRYVGNREHRERKPCHSEVVVNAKLFAARHPARPHRSVEKTAGEEHPRP